MQRVPYHPPYSAPRQPGFSPGLLGPLELVTPPSGRVVAVDALKSHDIVLIDDDDGDIEEYLAAAEEYVEQNVPGARQLLTATYDVPVAGWWGGELRLPRPPLQSVTSVKYYDTAGVQQTLAASYYSVRTPRRGPGTITRAPQQVFPPLQADRAYPVTVRMVCGYGEGTAVPAVLRQAIRMLAAHWYESRTAAESSPPQEVPFSVTALLESSGWGGYG